MLLNILLIVLIVVFIVFSVFLYIWWKNFGKELIKIFKFMVETNKNMMKNTNIDKNQNISSQIKMIQDFFNNRKLK
jgi:hypothetical protein